MENSNASRTQNTAKNIFWGYVTNIFSLILQFISRTVFIYTIGVSYLGINGLFGSVLGMLSLSELGIGTAINFSLYKPVAKENREKIKSLMSLYKKAYRVIAIVILVIGLVLLPFLPYLIRDANEIENVSLYYLIFLFNTVSSYFVSYKYGLINAEQKGYLINNLNSVFNAVILIVQIVILFIFRDYLVFLCVQAVFQLIQKVAINTYLNKKYPYLLEKNVQPLEKNETDKIKRNVKALVIHKIGEISIYQTDNIIISAFISVILVGRISNYNLIITSVTGFITIVFNSVTASIGNLVATESREKQQKIFDIYNFLGFWLYGFSCVCFWVLFQPFITLWIGKENLIDNFSLFLIILAQYLTGQRLTVNNMKTAGGVFEEDKYVSLIQGLINLIVSLIMANMIGLPGVYIGTVVSGLFANILRPIIVYRSMYNTSAKEYFKKFFIYLTVSLASGEILKIILNPILGLTSWLAFFGALVLCVVLVNLIFILIFSHTQEFLDIKSRLLGLIRRK